MYYNNIILKKERIMGNKKINPYFKKIFSLTIIIIINSISYIIVKPKKTIRIMSIGDSITDGSKAVGSYRKYLYNSLTKNGYSIKMVGPLLSDKFLNFKDGNENFSYEASHCGYPGYIIKTNSIKKGVMNVIQDNNYLIKYKPDVVILLIGTNDIQINIDVETVINYLKDFILYIKNNLEKNSFIFVSSIPPFDPNTKISYKWYKYCRVDKNNKTLSDTELKTILDKRTENYNNDIKKLVSSLRKDRINIYFSDLNSVIPSIENYFYEDGVHPNEKAHKLMGDYLYKQLRVILAKFK